MKIFKNLYLNLIALCCTLANAQTEEPLVKQNSFAVFEINDARFNGYDFTPQILENNAHLVLYKDSEINEIYLSNHWQKTNSQSYGRIYSVTKEENPENENFYKCELYRFRWSYINTYDKKEGTAKVELFVTYMPQGIYYELTILPENLDVFVYKGVMTGDLSELNCLIKK